MREREGFEKPPDEGMQVVGDDEDDPEIVAAYHVPAMVPNPTLAADGDVSDVMMFLRSFKSELIADMTRGRASRTSATRRRCLAAVSSTREEDGCSRDAYPGPGAARPSVAQSHREARAGAQMQQHQKSQEVSKQLDEQSRQVQEQAKQMQHMTRASTAASGPRTSTMLGDGPSPVASPTSCADRTKDRRVSQMYASASS